MPTIDSESLMEQNTIPHNETNDVVEQYGSEDKVSMANFGINKRPFFPSPPPHGILNASQFANNKSLYAAVSRIGVEMAVVPCRTAQEVVEPPATIQQLLPYIHIKKSFSTFDLYINCSTCDNGTFFLTKLISCCLVHISVYWNTINVQCLRIST